ncbi:MAG TPA: hypothetical protein VND90_09850 [Terracidiphilus sp.]|nr:hypothetical protein [Terracidiphilus sp.]
MGGPFCWRPWFDRRVIGTIRPMSGRSLAKKIDAEAYIQQQEGGFEEM